MKFTIGDRVIITESGKLYSKLATIRGAWHEDNVVTKYGVYLDDIEMANPHSNGGLYWVKPEGLRKLYPYTPDNHPMKKALNRIYGIESCDPRDAIKNVIFNPPATVIYWIDGSKTVVKCQDEDFDYEKGLAMAVAKKMLGNKSNFNNVFKKWIPEENRKKHGSEILHRLADEVEPSLYDCFNCDLFEDDQHNCAESCPKRDEYSKKE